MSERGEFLIERCCPFAAFIAGCRRAYLGPIRGAAAKMERGNSEFSGCFSRLFSLMVMDGAKSARVTQAAAIGPLLSLRKEPGRVRRGRSTWILWSKRISFVGRKRSGSGTRAAVSVRRPRRTMVESSGRLSCGSAAGFTIVTSRRTRAQFSSGT